MVYIRTSDDITSLLIFEGNAGGREGRSQLTRGVQRAENLGVAHGGAGALMI